jgi:hypothetical protein
MGSRTPVAVVAARRHAGEGKGGAAEGASEAGGLGDVVAGVAADPGRVAAEDVVHAGAGDVLAVGAGQAEVAGDRLEAVAGEIARREVVAEDRVHGVDELAARDGVAGAPRQLGHAVDGAAGQRRAARRRSQP